MSAKVKPDAVSSVRLRPGMYVGSADERGIEHLIFELVANSVDQFLAGRVTKVAVQLHADGRIEVADDGPGLPYEKAVPGAKSKIETCLTELHDSPTADGHHPHVHLNPFGKGLIVLSALSTTLDVVTSRRGVQWEQSFERGKPAAPVRSSPSKLIGTTWTFSPDPEMFGSHQARRSVVRARLVEVAHLFAGLKVSLGDECFHAPLGLLDYAHLADWRTDWDSPASGQSPIHVVAERAGMRLEAVAIGSAARASWCSWCNGTRTVGHGSHRDGFQDALRKLHRKPSIAMIHVIMTEPRFAAPSRRKLEAPAIRAIVRDCVLSACASS